MKESLSSLSVRQDVESSWRYILQGMPEMVFLECFNGAMKTHPEFG